MIDIFPDPLRLSLARILLVFLAFALAVLLRNVMAWILARPFEALLRRANVAGDINVTIQSVVLPPARYILLSLAIDISARILELQPALFTLATSVSSTLVIVAIGTLIFRLLNILISPRRLYLISGILIDEALMPFVRTALLIVTVALLLVILLQVWGYDVSGLVAGLGIGGLAFSLAAKDLLSNLFGFAAVVSDRPFVVGEMIKFADIEGTVEHVGIRTTRIRQADQAVVFVPNSKLADSALVNWSRLTKRRLHATLNISYAARAGQIETLLAAIRIALTMRASVEKNSVSVHFEGFRDNGLLVTVECYLKVTANAAFEVEQEKIFLNLMRIVAEHGLGFVGAPPVPQLDIPQPDLPILTHETETPHEQGVIERKSTRTQEQT